MNVRERTEQIERETLSPYAALSCNTRGRAREEEPCPMRAAFQRDRDRIIHSKSFRRLKQKTQVFLSPEGDHYRTRLTHTLEVAQIARTIARALRLNEDLTEAIALGHDLGHTPFGHAGERALNELVQGGFKHYEQSVRVATVLEREGEGLNLTYEVLDGIRCHTKGDWAYTCEGKIVRYADHIAYMNHDIEDAISAGVLKQSDLPIKIIDVLGNTKSERITTLITDMVESSKEEIRFSTAINEQYQALRDFMYSTVYVDKVAKLEEQKVNKLIQELFEYYCAHLDAMPPFYAIIAQRDGIERAVADYISGMSDEYATHVFSDIFIPKKWNL
ncbi:MAG: deoxyguanosinetriphosphate triphosphohydrolase [Oscillospiraceae bacterium]